MKNNTIHKLGLALATCALMFSNVNAYEEELTLKTIQQL